MLKRETKLYINIPQSITTKSTATNLAIWGILVYIMSLIFLSKELEY